WKLARYIDKHAPSAPPREGSDGVWCPAEIPGRTSNKRIETPMRLPTLRRMLNVTALGGAVGLLAALSATPAQANVEVGATAGLHSVRVNEGVGVKDGRNATSLRNSALFGLRLGMSFGDMLAVELEGGLIPTEERNLVYDVWVATYRAQVMAQFRAADPKNKV